MPGSVPRGPEDAADRIDLGGASVMRLTALPESACAAAFARHAARWERRAADRRNDTIRARYVHAHGALRLLLARALGSRLDGDLLRKAADGRAWTSGGRHLSISYCGREAYAALSSAPVGLDVIDGQAGGPALDPPIVLPEELAATPGAGSGRADLTVWAAKEAAAKLSGDVAAEPETWRLAAHPRGRRVLSAHPDIAVDFALLGGGRVAAVARWA